MEVVEPVGLTEAPVLNEAVGVIVAEGVMLAVADGVGEREAAVGSMEHAPAEPSMP